MRDNWPVDNDEDRGGTASHLDMLVILKKCGHGKYTRKNAQDVADLQTSYNKDIVKAVLGCVRNACSQFFSQV